MSNYFLKWFMILMKNLSNSIGFFCFLLTSTVFLIQAEPFSELAVQLNSLIV